MMSSFIVPRVGQPACYTPRRGLLLRLRAPRVIALAVRFCTSVTRSRFVLAGAGEDLVMVRLALSLP